MAPAGLLDDAIERTTLVEHAGKFGTALERVRPCGRPGPGRVHPDLPRRGRLAYDDNSMQRALLSALCWLGWNKTLDIVESDDEAVRERERASLDWWVQKARTTLESGAL